jgi:hypothetical protein
VTASSDVKLAVLISAIGSLRDGLRADRGRCYIVSTFHTHHYHAFVIGGNAYENSISIYSK